MSIVYQYADEKFQTLSNVKYVYLYSLRYEKWKIRVGAMEYKVFFPNKSFFIIST